MKNGFKKVAYVLGFIIIVILMVHCISYEGSRIDNEKIIERLQEEKSKVEINNEDNEIEKEEQSELSKKKKKKKILKEYRKLYQENNDMYGWIKIDGTEIDYPVMFTPKDPNFYENKNWEKQVCYNNVGSTIFIDGRTTSKCNNIIVYGHNMRNGSMFGSLKKYKEKEFYKEHKYIEFDTLYKKQKYEIICVSKAVVYYDKQLSEGEYLFYEHVELNSEEEFDLYVSSVKQNEYYNIENNAQYGDKLITLCTCDYWTENGRLIIVAKKIKE